MMLILTSKHTIHKIINIYSVEIITYEQYNYYEFVLVYQQLVDDRMFSSITSFFSVVRKSIKMKSNQDRLMS